MTDIEIIREMEKILQVQLEKLDLNDIVEYYQHLMQGYSIDETGAVTGLCLVEISIKPVLRFLDRLGRVSHLNINTCQLEEGDINFLHHWDNLTHLDIAKIKGNKNFSILRELKGLTWVNLSVNKLTDASFLSELKGLTYVGLWYNQLTDVSFLRELKGLTSVELRGNKLTDLSFVSDLNNLSYLGITDNPIKNPPPEIVKKGLTAIRDYFRSLKEGTEKKLNEVKVLLVGDGGAGKTSLVKRLLSNTFDKNEPQTDGININLLPIQRNDMEIKIRLWDFGGQEIMHATHQFFLSKRSLYIVVIDGRKDEDPEYWLKHIETFGGHSPIMVAINKIDENPGFEVNRRFLQDKYPNIKGFCRLSCKSGEGFDTFTKLLEESVLHIDILQSIWPLNWFHVKTTLENMTDHFISCQQYHDICLKEEITDSSSQETLVEFLNDLGVILNFKTLELGDTHILEPRWATNAVYKIINAKILATGNGVLALNRLPDILKNKSTDSFHVPREKYPYIINLMKKFELCYSLNEAQILIPDLLQVEEKDFAFDYATALKFIFKYDFLPHSIMPRFIVRMRGDIQNNLQWRTGVVLAERELGATAIIKADKSDHKIAVWVTGAQKRNYFTVIRKTLREINASFQKLEIKELVPLPDTNNEFVDYQELIGLERMEELFITIGKLGKKYPVKQLLDGIESEVERLRQSEDNKGHVSVTVRPSTLNPQETKLLLTEVNDWEVKFKKEQELKDFCDAIAEKRAKRFTWRFLALTVLLLIIWGILIFLFGWNKMEQWTFLSGIALIVVNMAFFALTGRMFNAEESRARRLKKEKNKQYILNRFILEEYELLQTKLAQAKNRLSQA